MSDAEDHHMRLPQRAPGAFEWNLNTILNLTTLAAVIIGGAGVLIGGGAGYQRLVNRIDQHDQWIARHDESQRERRVEVDSAITRLATLSDTLDDRADADSSRTDRLSDRVDAVEARGAELAATLRELQATLNAQSGDLKVILAWIEEQRRASRGSP